MIRRTPAYLPFKTFLSALDRLAQGVPPEVEKESFPTYSGAMQGQIIGALKFFDLIDDNGIPNGTMLQRLAREKTVGRRTNLLPLIKSAYSEIIKLGLTRLTPSKLDAAFDNYAISGDTKRRAKTFFIQAAQFTGLELSPLLTRRIRTSSKRKKQPGSSGVDRSMIDQSSISQQSEESVTIELTGGVTLTVILAGRLVGLEKQDREFAFGIIDSVNARKNSAS